MTAPSARTERSQAAPDTRRGRVGSWWSRTVNKIDAATSTPMLDYYMLAALTAILTGLGLLMVLSSSMASSLASSDSVWTDFSKQLAMVVVGLVAMYISVRMRPSTIKKLAPWGMFISMILLILVLVPGFGTGLEQMGSQSWLVLGPITLQPSEVAKLAISVWGAVILAQKSTQSGSVREVFGTFTWVVLAVIILVAMERDLGMVASVMIVFLALAWFVGLPRWVSATIVGGGLLLATILTLTAGYRSTRVEVFRETLFGRFPNTEGSAYQSYQGFLSLGDGSFFGQGLGQSRAKWFYLPEAKNDFIFAIVGEELGFVGAALVIILFMLLGWFGMKTALNQADPFLRLMAATVTTGIVIQAFINIGYVIGLLPVTGIQLPLISSGGTSAIITLTSMGLLLNCARHEPNTISAMRYYGRPVGDKLLGLPEPMPYVPAEPREKQNLSDRHHRVQRFGEPVTRRRMDSSSRRSADPASASRIPGASPGRDEGRRAPGWDSGSAGRSGRSSRGDDSRFSGRADGPRSRARSGSDQPQSSRGSGVPRARGGNTGRASRGRGGSGSAGGTRGAGGAGTTGTRGGSRASDRTRGSQRRDSH